MPPEPFSLVTGVSPVDALGAESGFGSISGFSPRERWFAGLLREINRRDAGCARGNTISRDEARRPTPSPSNTNLPTQALPIRAERHAHEKAALLLSESWRTRRWSLGKLERSLSNGCCMQNYKLALIALACPTWVRIGGGGEARGWRITSSGGSAR